MRALVTGGTGFAGSHLIDTLLAAGDTVTVLVHAASSITPLPQHPDVRAVAGDLLTPAALDAAFEAAQPEVVYHLAGQASPSRSWDIPAQTLLINTIGTVNLLEAAVRYGQPRVVIVTSADIYGNVSAADLPLTEASVAQPRHPYGVSKLAAAQFVPLYWARHGLPVVEARPFNHIGPRQALGFVVPDFASQLAAITLGQAPPRMRVGNLDAQRDFTDVRDVVAAYRMLALAGQPGQGYLICSGQPVTIHYLLSTLVALSGQQVDIEYDPARMRPADIPCLYGTAARLQRDTGWTPQVHLRQSLAESLDEWVTQLAEAAG